jgi:hypothetical protein
LVSVHAGHGVASAVDKIETLLDQPTFRASLPARQRAQGRAWAESQLAESIGQVGLAMLAPRLGTDGPPFRTVLSLIERVRASLHEIVKNI